MSEKNELTQFTPNSICFFRQSVVLKETLKLLNDAGALERGNGIHSNAGALEREKLFIHLNFKGAKNLFKSMVYFQFWYF
jgi:hypothetical protein